MSNKRLHLLVNDELGCNMSKCGIYAISNILTGKIYIGQTANSFGARHYGHSRRLELGNHPNRHLQNASIYFLAPTVL